MLLHSDPQRNFNGSNGDYGVNCANLPMLLVGSCVIIPGHLCKLKLLDNFSLTPFLQQLPVRIWMVSQRGMWIQTCQSYALLSICNSYFYVISRKLIRGTKVKFVYMNSCTSIFSSSKSSLNITLTRLHPVAV